MRPCREPPRPNLSVPGRCVWSAGHAASRLREPVDGHVHARRADSAGQPVRRAHRRREHQVGARRAAVIVGHGQGGLGIQIGREAGLAAGHVRSFLSAHKRDVYEQK